MGAPIGNRNAAGSRGGKSHLIKRLRAIKKRRKIGFAPSAYNKGTRYNSKPNRIAQHEVSKAWERSHGKGSTPAGRYGG